MFSRGAGADAESDIATDVHADADIAGESGGGAVVDSGVGSEPGEDPGAGRGPGVEGGGDAEGDTESGAEGAAEAGDPDTGYVRETEAEGGAEPGDPGHPDDGLSHLSQSDGEEDFDPEASFFGMQSEGVVLTGVALGPGLRRLGRVCLAAALGLGVLFWVVLVMLYAYRVFIESPTANPDLPHLVDDRPWTAYYLVGALWAVAVGSWGLATRGGYARLTWCFACLVTAFFWPLGMAASAAAAAIRGPAAAMSRRLLLAGLAVLVAAGGLAWRVDGPATGPSQAAVSSDSDLLGTWHSRSGISVQLLADGTFAGESLSGGGMRDGDAIATASGRWEAESADGHSGVRLLVNGDLSNSLYFDLYKAGPELVLCSSNDPGEPCEVVLRRS
ncbi:MAG: hypothetical protein HOW97_12470 [Catenulispora sp.]|nr:hypothetical protein [Catenulispora sp.]